MRPTLSKSALQTKSGVLSTQIGTLTTRKGELEAELVILLAAIESRSQDISAAILAGTDPAADQEANLYDKAKAEDLRSAIAQADEQIRLANMALSDCAAGISLWDLYTANDAVESKLLASIDKFYEAIATFEEITPLYHAVSAVGNGTNTDHWDETRQTRAIYTYVQSFIKKSDGVVEELKKIEAGYPAYLTEIRAKFA